MASRPNAQSRARRRAGKRLAELISKYNLSLREIAKATGIDITTLQNLSKFTPHLNTIEKVAAYVEQVARSNKSRT